MLMSILQEAGWAEVWRDIQVWTTHTNGSRSGAHQDNSREGVHEFS